MTFYEFSNIYDVDEVVVHCDGAYKKVNLLEVKANRTIGFFNGLHIKPKILKILYFKSLRDINNIRHVHVYCNKVVDNL